MMNGAQMKWDKNKKYIRHNYHEQHGEERVQRLTPVKELTAPNGNYFGSDQVHLADIVQSQVSFV